MNNNDELDLIKSEDADDAQIVKESELLPIFNVMDYSGDIQPLEDIVEPEKIVTDYDRLKAESRNSEKNRDLKKKFRPRFRGINITLRQIITGLVIAIFVCGVITGAYFILTDINTNDSPISAVYESENKTVIKLENGDSYDVHDAQSVKVSKDGMLMYYSRNTASKTGQFDIRVIDISKKNSLEKAGFYIDNGINEDWQINDDGSFMCYSKTVSGITEYYMYSVESGKSELITNDMEELFMPSKGDVVYFTRRNGTTYSLHRMSYGENSQNVVSGMDYARLCKTDGDYEVLYTVKSGHENNVDVYSVKGLDNPVKICSDASEVYPQDYIPGGNLYYFSKNESNINWQDFITDKYSESDASMVKPVEGDYMVEKGFIFKRYVLDTFAYDTAVETYNKKLARDKVREELNKMNLGLAVRDEYTCYVYDGKMSRKLATGVELESIIDYCATGSPRIIYSKSVINAGSKISMDKLVSLSSNGSVSRAIDYVRETVGNSYTVNNDCIYSWFDGNKVLEYTINEYQLKDTKFIPGTRNALYALSGGNLYCNTISSSKIEAKQLIDSNVSESVFSDNVLYYNKIESDDNKTLYRYTAENGKEKVFDNVYSYFPITNDFMILLSKQDTDGELMNIGLFVKGNYTSIDTDANLNHFTHNGTGFAYIKNVSDNDNSLAGEIYTYSQSKGVNKCGDKAIRIFYTHE